MSYEIVIPTCKTPEEVAPIIKAIKETVVDDVKVFASCLDVSAATNRNYCLDQCKSEYVIMLDDDIEGFTPNWAEKLLEPFETVPATTMVSARLMLDKNNVGIMMNIQYDAAATWQVIEEQFLPSACIAFRNDGCRFDEAFVGSSWEDTDFCVTLQNKYPYGLFMINNDVKLIHLNDQKNGNPEIYAKNKAYFQAKHGVVL